MSNNPIFGKIDTGFNPEETEAYENQLRTFGKTKDEFLQRIHAPFRPKGFWKSNALAGSINTRTYPKYRDRMGDMIRAEDERKAQREAEAKQQASQ